MCGNFLRHRVLIAVSVVALAATVVSSQAPEQPLPEQFNRGRIEAVLSAIREGLPYVPGEILVKFRDGTSVEQRSSALRVLRSSANGSNGQWIGDVLHLTHLGAEEPLGAAAAVARQPEVEFAEPNYIYHLQSIPNDPGFRDQWNLDQINMPRAWEMNVSAGKDVVVGVLDSGLTTIDGTFGFRLWTGFAFATFGIPFARTADFNHEQVRLAADFSPFSPTGGWRTSSGQTVLFDAGGHGTHVSGTIAQQTNNSSGYAGIANGATLMPVKVCFEPWDLQLAAGALGIPGFANESDSGCDMSAAVRGIRYAVDNGATVINMSVGGPVQSQALLDALRYAVQRGTFVSIAAGNDALEGNPTMYPAAYGAVLEGVVAVGALGPSQTRAAYSNHGPYVELVAPGGAAYSGPTEDIWQVVPHPDDLRLTRLAPAFSRYVGSFMAGTSIASPHVAGLAALAYSQGIKDPRAIEAAMKRFAKDLGVPGRDNEYGYGLIDARSTLFGLGLSR
jgi:serine protease